MNEPPPVRSPLYFTHVPDEQPLVRLPVWLLVPEIPAFGDTGIGVLVE